MQYTTSKGQCSGAFVRIRTPILVILNIRKNHPVVRLHFEHPCTLSALSRFWKLLLKSARKLKRDQHKEKWKMKKKEKRRAHQDPELRILIFWLRRKPRTVKSQIKKKKNEKYKVNSHTPLTLQHYTTKTHSVHASYPKICIVVIDIECQDKA